jgi:hypothetical protein
MAKGEGAEWGKTAGPSTALRSGRDDKFVKGVVCVAAIPACRPGAAAGKAIAAAGPTLNGESSVIAGAVIAGGWDLSDIWPLDGMAGTEGSGIPISGSRVSKAGMERGISGAEEACSGCARKNSLAIRVNIATSGNPAGRSVCIRSANDGARS